MDKIVHYPNKILREPAETVDFEKMSILDRVILYFEMFTELRDHEGVGIAAPQVGSRKNVAIIKDQEGKFIAVANLRVTQMSEPFTAVEGCLSSPGKQFKIKRYRSVTIFCQYLFTGKSKKLRLTGIPAQIAQHEYDHLVGRTLEEFGKELAVT